MIHTKHSKLPKTLVETLSHQMYKPMSEMLPELKSIPRVGLCLTPVIKHYQKIKTYTILKVIFFFVKPK